MFTYLVLWVQVLSEMLPISSSTQVELLRQWYVHCHGNLPVIIPEGFEYLLHVPLLVVVPFFFARGWWGAVTVLVQRVWHRERLHAWSTRQLLTIMSKLIGLIFVCGVLAEGFRQVLKLLGDCMWLRPAGLVVTALLLFFVSFKKSWTRFGIIKQSSWHILWIVGIAQAVALLPGISRMGATVTVAILCGLSVRRSLEFSFALQYPLVLAAVFFRCLPWLCSTEAVMWVQPFLLVHLIVAGVVSYGLLKLAAYLFSTRRTWMFGGYVLLCALWLVMR